MAQLSSPSGMPTGALYGVLNMLRRLRMDVAHDYACCIFDAKGDNFRHALYPAYKANRPPMPDDLRPQAAALPELVALMGWPVLAVPGVEADDVIGTLARGFFGAQASGGIGLLGLQHLGGGAQVPVGRGREGQVGSGSFG